MVSAATAPFAPRSVPGAPPGPSRIVRFHDLDLEVDEGVLAPRAWTEVQAQWAAELAPALPSGRILELCCGAGQIGLLAARRSGRAVVQVDADPRACELAARNARRAGWGEQTEVRCAPVAAALGPAEQYPLVLADPPYLRREELTAHPDDPRFAIDGGEDGLAVVRECLAVMARAIVPGGAGLLQLRGRRQAAAVEHDLPRGLVAAGVRDVDPDRAVMLVRPSRDRPSRERS